MNPRNPIKRLLDPTDEKAAVLTPKQFRNLLILAGEGRHGLRNKAIIWHAFGSALRVTEIANLKVRDVIDKSGEIKKLATLPSSYTKNGKSRPFIQIDPEQRIALQAYMDYRVNKKLRTTGKKDYLGLQPSSPLYLSRGVSGFSLTRKRYTRADGSVEEYKVATSLQHLMTGMLHGVGVMNGSSHSGRRTLATRLSERGIEDELIMSLLGHGEPNMTMVYIDANIDKIQNAMASIYPGLR